MSEGILAIQSNWQDLLSTDSKDVWAYYKKKGEKSINGKLKDKKFSFRTFEQDRTVEVTFKPNLEKMLFVAPFKTFSSLHEQSIISLDVTSGGLAVSVSTDNKLHVWEAERDVVRRCLDGHLFDVYTCKFFPSGLVVLSGGADMQLKIWDAITGDCAVTLQGHTAAITDTEIIDKGKNILSVSRDGTVRLWNCAESKCLSILLNANSEINCCALLNDTDQDMITQNLENDVGSNKLLAVGCESGDVYIVSILDKQTHALHRLVSSVLCMCWMDEFNLAIGTFDGAIFTLDLKNIATKPKLLCHDSCSAVLSIIPFKNGIFIGRRDGICQFYNKDGLNTVQFTGSDCDPVYSIAKDETYIYAACRDTSVRKYRIKDFEEYLL